MKRLCLFTLIAAALHTPCLASTYFISVNLRTNDLVYDPVSKMIYASVPSSAGAMRGNTITPINPTTGALGTSVFVASEPTLLALADDGSRLYVASDSTNLVTPFSLTTMSPGTPFPIGSGDRRVDDMEAAPGQPGALAVSRKFGNQNVGIAIFVDGVKLPNEQSDVAINDVIEFGASSNILYGHANSFSEYDFNSFAIDLSATGGIGGGYHVKYLLTQSGLDMEYQNGRMYFTNGQVLDVSTPGPIGSFNASGHVEPVGTVGRTYFVQGSRLKSFSQTTFVPLGDIAIPEMSGAAKNLISLGDDGLAMATTGGQVIIARGSLMQGPTADFNEDGYVNGADFLIWQRGFGAGNVTLSSGDSNGDGLVNGSDLAIWKQQFGTRQPTPAAAVPEPATRAIGGGGLLLAAIAARRMNWACMTSRGFTDGARGFHC